MPRIVQGKGERTEAWEGNGSKTAKGSMHAGEQINGQGEPHNDLEGEGSQENTVQGQSGRAGKHTIGLDAKKAPTTSEPGTRIDVAEGPTSTRPSIQAEAELWPLFPQSLPWLWTSTRPDAFTLTRP